MANIRGGSFEKQGQNLFHKLEAFGTSRDGDHQTHSVALAKKREMYIRDLVEYAKENFDDGKLNQVMTPDRMSDFLNNRLEGMAESSKEGYIRGMSSMFQGMEEKNISTHLNRDYFDKVAATVEVKEEIINRYVDNANEIKFDRPATDAFKDLVLETGFRASEAMEVLKNPSKYINGNMIEEVIGKGRHEYAPKEISHNLIQKIQNLGEDKTTLDTIRKDLKEENIKPHDLRFTYARNEYEAKIEQGIPHKEVLKEISQELNHQREEITNYYLKRT